MDEKYLIGGGLEGVEGRYTVLAQVDAVLGEGQTESIIRVVREAPPTR